MHIDVTIGGCGSSPPPAGSGNPSVKRDNILTIISLNCGGMTQSQAAKNGNYLSRPLYALLGRATEYVLTPG